MTKTPVNFQDLRRSLYIKAKAEPAWRFWRLYVHVCKMETLHEAYEMAKKNDGAPGIDGVTFEAIEQSGEESFLQQIRNELVSNTYRPMSARKKEIPKDGGTKVRVLSIQAPLRYILRLCGSSIPRLSRRAGAQPRPPIRKEPSSDDRVTVPGINHPMWYAGWRLRIDGYSLPVP